MASCDIIEGDCIEVMKTMSAGSINIVVTDPPYNVGLEYATIDDRRVDYREWCQQWFNEIKRVCSGHILISVGQANLSLWAAMEKPDWWLAWWKPAAMGRCVVGFNNWEPIAVYKRGKMAKQGCDVIRATIDTRDKLQSEHPCPKPIDWAVKQLEMFSFPDDIVLDPFMGSGTTGVACKKMNRKFMGIECDHKYCDLAKRRINNVIEGIFND